MTDCSSLQRSLAWCQGRPELPGVKRRIYYISKYDILQWPTLPHDANGRLTGSAYQGNFTLRADASWKYIDIIPDKSQLTSEPQGEYPSQTQLNKLVAVHPSVGAEASAAAAYLNNNDNVFLVEDMHGAFRVVGSDLWPTKTTVNQDLGQGAAGSASTTINVEASDECPAPFYTGNIVTDEGTTSGTNVNSGGSNTGANTGSNTGGNTGGSTGGNTGGSTGSGTPSYNSNVVLNGQSYNVNKGGTVNISGNLTSMMFTGSNMTYLSYKPGSSMETEIDINSAGTSASCNEVVTAPNTVKIYRREGSGDNAIDVLWFTINLTSSGSSGSNTGGSTGGNDVCYTSADGSSINKAANINGNSQVIQKDGVYNLTGALTSFSMTGNNMHGLKLFYYDHMSDGSVTQDFTISADQKTATWTGNISPRTSVYLKYPDGNTSNPKDVTIATIELFNEGESIIEEA